MKRSDELKEQRQSKVDAMNSLYEKAQNEKRMLSDDEQKTFDQYRSEIEALDKNIESAVFMEEQERRKAANEADQRRKQQAKATPEEKLSKSFSLLRAINTVSSGRALEGAEAEAYQETQSEYRGFSKSLDGNIGVPSFIVYPELSEKRDQNVGTDADGGYGVFTDFAGHIDPLRPRPMVEMAGATMLRGLTGNVRFTKNGVVTGVWEGETDANAEVTSAFSVLDMSPKRVGATSTISKQLLIQSSPDVQRIVAREIGSAIERAVDLAALNGASGGLDPTGILNTAGVNAVAIGTNGGAATWAKIVEMETAIAEADGDIGNMAYMFTPGTRGHLKTVEKASSTAQFLWDTRSPDSPVNGYASYVTTQLPSDLTKGTGTSLHAAIFGVWSALYLGNWGGLDIVVDPYSAKKTAQIEYTVNSWWDVGVRHAAQFAHIKDIDVA